MHETIERVVGRQPHEAHAVADLFGPAALGCARFGRRFDAGRLSDGLCDPARGRRHGAGSQRQIDVDWLLDDRRGARRLRRERGSKCGGETDDPGAHFFGREGHLTW